MATSNPHSKTGNQAKDLCDQAKRQGRTIHLGMVKEVIGDDGEKTVEVSDTHEKRLTWEPRDDMGHRIIEENIHKGEVTYRNALVPHEARELVKHNKASLEDDDE